MKILILSRDDYPHIGGKSTHIANIIEGYKAIGGDTEVLCQNCINGFLFNLIRAILIPIRCISKNKYTIIWNDLVLYLYSKKILKFCNQKQFDVISAQDAFSAAACYKVKKCNIPVVITMHTYFGIENSLDKGVSIDSKIYKKMLEIEQSSLYIADGIIAVDTRIEQHIIKTLENLKLKKYPISVKTVNKIFNFTNTDIFKPVSDEEREKIREQYNIDKKMFIIVCTRRLVEKNGVINVVKAVNEIPDKFNLQLLIIGDGPQKNQIENYIENNSIINNIKLLGEIENNKIANMYQLADIGIVPSVTVNGLQEATSLSAIESMSCGLPTIASNIGGLKEIIIHNKNGILVEEGNPKQIADWIVYLMNNKDEYKRLSYESRDHILKNHSHLSAAKKYLHIFSELN